MSENIRNSSSLNQMANDFTHLKQQLEYFERHIQNSKNQAITKEYFRTLAKVIEAENALRHFTEVFNSPK
jgi:septal ring factor EnvC (AmiA/AmiB activator)